MIASATLQNDAFFFAGLGVDGLADIDVTVGGSTVFDLEFADMGGNTALGLSGTMVGGQGVAVEDVAQTGTEGDGAALLLGASGVDTLGDIDAAVTCCNTSGTLADAAETGINTVLALDTAPVSGVSRDVSVALILHRIAMISAIAPAAISLRTGFAG